MLTSFFNLETHEFRIDLLVLPIEGAELLVRIQRLELLGAISYRFQKLDNGFYLEGVAGVARRNNPQN